MKRPWVLLLCSVISLTGLSGLLQPTAAGAVMSTSVARQIALMRHLLKTTRPRPSKVSPFHPFIAGRSEVTRRGVLSPSSLSDGQLRLPGSAFAPAIINPTYDYAESAATADQNWFRNNHWWSYSRLGMASGYYERADTHDSNGYLISFRWQATVYPSVAAASRAIQDGISRTKTYGSGGGCYSIYHVACYSAAYTTNQTDNEAFEIVQINRCVGESAATENQAVFEANADAILNTAAQLEVAGEGLLASVCRGASSQSGPAFTQRNPASVPASGFRGNCFAYRGHMWGIAQQIGVLQSQWWIDLERDYNNNYPPPTGGSVPGVTGAQFQAAQADMVAINQQLDNQTNHTGLEWDVIALDVQHGINDRSNKGPFNWASDRVFGAAYLLERAAYEEWQKTAAGLSDFHVAQQYLSNSWDALKQLPCQNLARRAQTVRAQQPPKQAAPVPSAPQALSVQAWVSPSSMAYGAYPTLYAKTAPGATCTAAVVYSTGYRPRSFDGSGRRVPANGIVSWSWHEETKGSGGNASVSCALNGRTATTSASFAVG